MEVKPLKRSQTLLNVFFGFLCLFVFLSSVEQENLNPNTCDKKQKHLTFFNDLAQNFPPFLSYLNQGSKFCSSRRSSRLRPAGVGSHKWKPTAKRKKTFWKRRFWNKELTHSQNNSHKRTARYKISRMLRASANAYCPRTL